MVRKISACLLAACLLLVTAAPSFAAGGTISGRFGAKTFATSQKGSPQYNGPYGYATSPSSGLNVVTGEASSGMPSDHGWVHAGLWGQTITSDVIQDGVPTIYISFYLSNLGAHFLRDFSLSGATPATYSKADGSTYKAPWKNGGTFQPATADTYHTPGQTLTCSVPADQAGGGRFDQPESTSWGVNLGYFYNASMGSMKAKGHITSFRIVVSPDDKAAEELQNLVEQVTQSNIYLGAIAGDVAALLHEAKMANIRLETIVTYLQTINGWLEQIARDQAATVDKLDAIYNMISANMSKIIWDIGSFQNQAHSDHIFMQSELEKMSAILDEWWTRQKEMEDFQNNAGIGGWTDPEQGAQQGLDVFGGGTGAQDKLNEGFNTLDQWSDASDIAQVAAYIFGPFVGVSALFVMALFLIRKASG